MKFIVYYKEYYEELVENDSGFSSKIPRERVVGQVTEIAYTESLEEFAKKVFRDGLRLNASSGRYQIISPYSIVRVEDYFYE